MVHEDSDAAEGDGVEEMPAKDLMEEVEVVRSDSTDEEEEVLP